jgi:hypothetical protein
LLTLVFSETVNINYLNASTIHLVSSMVRDSNTSVVSLADPARVSTIYSASVNITLSYAQMVALQLSDGIGTLVNKTFIQLGYGACIDMSSNENVYQGTDATFSNARQVRTLSPDVSRPMLVGASLDLTAQTIAFTFSEVVKIKSLTSSQVSIQSQGGASTATETVIGLTSTKATVITKKNSVTIKYKMTATLFNTIKKSTLLGRSVNSTFAAFTKLFVTDVSSPANQILPVSTAAAMQFTNFVPDTVAPSLISWYFNNDLSEMVLTFTEPMDIPSFDVRQITLTSASYVSPATTTFTLTASSRASSLSTNALVVIVYLALSDANAIKVRTPLCVSYATCYISFTSAMATDTATYTAG